MIDGESVDQPKIANLTDPVSIIRINGMAVDMHKLKAAADRLGAKKGDVLSIGGYRDHRGVLVPDYDTVRIENRDG